MIKRENSYKLINLGVAVMAMVIVICIAVSLTVLARPLYYFDIENLQIPQKSGISAEACKLNYDTLIDYNMLLGEDELSFPTLRMSETGKIHFEEVKDIFITMQVISIIGIIFLIGWAIYLKREGAREEICLWMKYTFPVTISVALVCAGAMIIDWEWAFTTMHHIFFDNDYWIFNSYTDPVIKILPEEFFFHCGITIVALVILQITTLRIAFRRLLR